MTVLQIIQVIPSAIARGLWGMGGLGGKGGVKHKLPSKTRHRPHFRQFAVSRGV